MNANNAFRAPFASSESWSQDGWTHQQALKSTIDFGARHKQHGSAQERPVNRIPGHTPAAGTPLYEPSRPAPEFPGWRRARRWIAGAAVIGLAVLAAWLARGGVG